MNRKVLGLVVMTGIVWGSGGVLSKALVNAGVDAFVITGVPFSVGAAIAWAIGAGHGRRTMTLVRDGLMLGAVNSGLPALFFNLAYESLPAGIVALLLSLGPMVTAVTAHFAFRDEQFNARKGAGLVLCVLGVGALAFTPGLLAGSSSVGAAFALGGAAIGGASAIFARRLAVKHGARAIVAPQLTAAGAMPLLLAPMLGRSFTPALGWEPWQILSLVGIGCVASYLGFRMIMRANETGTTGEVSIVGYVVPMVGVIGGVVFLAEDLTSYTVIGGALILAGIAMVGRASGKPARVVRASG